MKTSFDENKDAESVRCEWIERIERRKVQYHQQKKKRCGQEQKKHKILRRKKKKHIRRECEKKKNSVTEECEKAGKVKKKTYKELMRRSNWVLRFRCLTCMSE